MWWWSFSFPLFVSSSQNQFFQESLFLSRHLFHCLIQSSDKASPAWRRRSSHCDLYIFAVCHYASNQKQKMKKTTNMLCMAWSVLGICICQPEQMKNATSHTSLKRFIFILLLYNRIMVTKAIGKSGGLSHKMVLLCREHFPHPCPVIA